jgi:mercuric ion binding protein
MKRASILLSLFVALLVTTALVPEARAQDKVEKPDVTVEVDGLACPFCAYGLEKKLKKIDGVEALEVQIDDGQVKIKLKENAQVSEEDIREAVADAGFTVRAITWASRAG